jgi:uncharacterized protein YjbI with pentapeptide repeats
MAIDPKDVGELQKALNDAAGKASVLWTTFITFQLYLAIAFGSVTHRDLFLETPIKLPLLNVDLPLVGFFVVAPTVLVIFHFYVFLQLLGLATKAKDYNTLLVSEAPVAADRQYLRQRLDSFLVLQVLAGPRDQRTGFGGLSLRLIAWITLVGTPVLILLQGQVTFLPYHRDWIVWLQRIAVLIDLVMIWYFWVRLRSDADPILRRVPGKVWMSLGGGGSFCVVLFSAYLATFPGEWVDEHLPEFRYVPTTWRPHWSEEEDWTSLQDMLFKGTAIDEISGRPRSVFSNRLVLTDQSFIVDPDKLDKVDVSRSFRGRDLSQAVLNRADLRKADFTGAILNGARFEGTKLRNALFGCARTGKKGQMGSSPDADVGCTWLQGASLDKAQLQGASLDYARLEGASLREAQLEGASLERAQLQGASLDYARLQGASLDQAQLEGASLDYAQLQGASLDQAQLQGASLVQAQLQGASLREAQLQGASLDYAQLQGASLDWAQLRGASLNDARLQGASLQSAQLQGASLVSAELQGASLEWAQLQGASLRNAKTWRASARLTLDLELTDLQDIEVNTLQLEQYGTFAEWRDAIAASIPAGARRDLLIDSLAALGPAAEKEPEGVLDPNFWEKARSSQPQGGERKRRLAAFLTDLACSADSAPYVARGLLRNQQVNATGAQFASVVDRLRKGKSDLTACPGVNGFTDEDWAYFDQIRLD